MHDDLVFERCSEVKARVSINHSSYVCLNCYLKFPFFEALSVAKCWALFDEGEAIFFFSICIICGPINP